MNIGKAWAPEKEEGCSTITASQEFLRLLKKIFKNKMNKRKEKFKNA